MRLRTAFAAFVVLGVLSFIGVRSASAQDLWLGYGVVVPQNHSVFEAAFDGRPHDFHGSTMSFMAGGGIGGTKTGLLGGGLRWSWKCNDKCGIFVGFLAGVVWHPDPTGATTETGFGMTPLGGLTYKLNKEFGLFAVVGLGTVTGSNGAGMHVGTQISGGLTLSLKH